MAGESSEEELMGSVVNAADNLEAQLDVAKCDESSDAEDLLGKDGKKKSKKKKREREFTKVQLEKRKDKGTQRTGKKSGRPDKVKAGKRRCADCGKDKNLTEFTPANAICTEPCLKTKQNVYNRSFFSLPPRTLPTPAQLIFSETYFLGVPILLEML